MRGAPRVKLRSRRTRQLLRLPRLHRFLVRLPRPIEHAVLICVSSGQRGAAVPVLSIRPTLDDSPSTQARRVRIPIAGRSSLSGSGRGPEETAGSARAAAANPAANRAHFAEVGPTQDLARAAPARLHRLRRWRPGYGRRARHPTRHQLDPPVDRVRLELHGRQDLEKRNSVDDEYRACGCRRRRHRNRNRTPAALSVSPGTHQPGAGAPSSSQHSEGNRRGRLEILKAAARGRSIPRLRFPGGLVRPRCFFCSEHAALRRAGAASDARHGRLVRRRTRRARGRSTRTALGSPPTGAGRLASFA
jgi:hypothetical protein